MVIEESWPMNNYSHRRWLTVSVDYSRKCTLSIGDVEIRRHNLGNYAANYLFKVCRYIFVTQKFKF